MSAAIFVENDIFVIFYQMRSLLTQRENAGYQLQNSVADLRSVYNEFSKKLLTQLYLFSSEALPFYRTRPDTWSVEERLWWSVQSTSHCTVTYVCSTTLCSRGVLCVGWGGGEGSDEGSARVRCGASSSSACPWPHYSLRQNCIDKYLDTNPNVKRYTNLSSRKWFTFVPREQPT